MNHDLKERLDDLWNDICDLPDAEFEKFAAYIGQNINHVSMTIKCGKRAA